ncbi:uncharacterized protein LOC132739825 [Ruditapes philippinarum]|uniref:uncharacterized protein LOC132739825 n=1 Tax=Ruditapes philippinarum TaxID=129788 RepID=UPI00295A7C25|nr:uncharacterized protein LOC132739825 [Ruditapes philippinarum]
MCHIRSLVLVVFTISAIDALPQLRRFLNNQSPVQQGHWGDPMHQGGNYMQQQQQQQNGNIARCVTPSNPCHCSMNLAQDMKCLVCSCGTSYTSGPAQFSTQAPSLISSTHNIVSTTSPTPPVTSRTPPTTITTMQQAPSTTITATTEARTTTAVATTTASVDFCDVAKQLCQTNCPDGYLVDPADCTFCICKKDALSG